MRALAVAMLVFFAVDAVAQAGLLAGNVVDEKGKALEGATVRLIPFPDSTAGFSTTSDKAGAFAFDGFAYGWYRLRISYVSLQNLTLDSLHFRTERSDFQLNDLVMKPRSQSGLEEIIIYAEKPLIQTKDGNITFNAGESALSQGSTASDLLTQVPLVSKDPNGKVLVRGKEPRILIDDKPVELNLQQLQDLLESLPGSSIEKIEVLTNPPPQYASEQGGVINITTRKGAVGISGRISLYAGSRGEAGANGSFNYRKNRLALAVNAGAVANQFSGNGYSNRQNIYPDSINFFNTTNNFRNRNLRPNLRINLDYEFSKRHLINVVLLYNQNDFSNRNSTLYQNVNRFGGLYRISQRSIQSQGFSYNPNVSFTYTYRTKIPGEVLRLFTNWNVSPSETDRFFYQQYLNADRTFTGNDSTQQQLTNNHSIGYNIRLSYDRPLPNKTTSISVGGFYNRNTSDVQVNALYKPKNSTDLLPVDALSNNFLFYQYVANLRASVRQIIGKAFSVTAGLNAEATGIHFDLRRTGSDTSNRYWTMLPFANLNKTFANNTTLTVSYRRTIRRPGINELNPTLDFGDPYNIRSGNPALLPSPSHQFDVVVGRAKGGFYANLGVGHNIVQDIYNPIRELIGNGVTQTIWQNISGRKEFETSLWSGYTFSRKLRTNTSASYTYNKYGEYDKTVRRYRDGGSLTANLNTVYSIRDLYSATASLTYNRFAAPQGTVRSTVSMNLALQARLLRKRMTLTLNLIDPFVQQRNHSFTYGPAFALESYTSTQTRNYRLSLGWSFIKTAKKPVKNIKAALKNLVKPAK